MTIKLLQYVYQLSINPFFQSIQSFIYSSSIYLSVCLCMSLQRSKTLSVLLVLTPLRWLYLFIYHVSTYLSMYLSMYLLIYLSVYLSIYLSISLSLYLSIYLSLHLSIYLSIYIQLLLTV